MIKNAKAELAKVLLERLNFCFRKELEVSNNKSLFKYVIPLSDDYTYSYDIIKAVERSFKARDYSCQMKTYARKIEDGKFVNYYTFEITIVDKTSDLPF